MKLLKNGFWIPDSDIHFEKWFENRNWEPYQIRAILKGLALLNGKTRVAIDGGAHVGFITRYLQYLFSSVWAFEPSPINFECLKRNCLASQKLYPKRYALGDKTTTTRIHLKKNNTGGNYTSVMSGKSVKVVTIDSYNLEDVDFIKLDIQGDEYKALVGAEATIKRCSPVLMIEDKIRDKIPQLLKGWNYKYCSNYKKDTFWRYRY